MRGPSSIAVFVLATSLFVLGGCVVDEEPEGEAARPPASTEPAESVSIEASAPFASAEDVTAERLEAERFDRSWERYARENLQARQSASTDTRAQAPGARGDRGDRADEMQEMESVAPTDASGNPYLARLRGGDSRPASANGTEGSGDADRPDAPDQPAADSGGESWEGITPEALRTGEVHFPLATEGGGPTAFRVQWLLDRVSFSPGVLDGRWGKNTEKAVYWLQEALGMEPTGRIDRDLYDRLDSAVDERSPVRRYTVTAQDLEGPFTEIPEDPEAQAELECLCYASPQELLAERFHTTGELLAQLNPETDLANLQQGTELWVPAVEVAESGSAAAGEGESQVARIVISRGGFYVQALNDAGDVLFHFPSTMGSQYNPSPDGSFEVEGVGWNPDFHYQPELLDNPDQEQTVEEDLLLPAGPNSPVGVVWMQLSKPHYGIHGTARPETIGYSTSHGCIRMTNWDAVFLGHRVSPGTPVEFRP